MLRWRPVLGAQTQGMIGYFFLQAIKNALPAREVVSLICQTEVAANDPAFSHPTKFVGRVYSEQEAQRLAALRGWQVRPDGSSWRRVVASPEPLKMLELHAIRLLLADGALVICAGGGGIPVLRAEMAVSGGPRQSSTRTWVPRCWPRISRPTPW